MEGNSTLALVLCLTFAGVIGINAVIIMWARRKDPMSEFKVFRRLYDSSRNPLKPADDQLAELADLVAKLERGSKPQDPIEQENNG